MSDEAKERLVIGGSAAAAILTFLASAFLVYISWSRDDSLDQARDNVMVPELVKRVERIERDTRKTREAVHELHILVTQMSERLEK